MFYFTHFILPTVCRTRCKCLKRYTGDEICPLNCTTRLPVKKEKASIKSFSFWRKPSNPSTPPQWMIHQLSYSSCSSNSSNIPKLHLSELLKPFSGHLAHTAGRLTSVVKLVVTCKAGLPTTSPEQCVPCSTAQHSARTGTPTYEQP